MGCSQSKIENEEVVSRCKDRKMFMKDAVAARNAFAAAHSSYAMSLKNTGAVLSDYAQGESPPAPSSLPGVTGSQSAAAAASASYNSLPPPPPPLPGSPGMPLQQATSMFEIKASKVEPKRVEPVIEEVDENDFEIECSVGPLQRRSNRDGGGRGVRTGAGELAEEENGPPPPFPPSSNRPPPPKENRRIHMPSPQDSTYDYLFSVENMPAPTLSGVEDFNTNTEAIERREKSGEEPSSSSAGKTPKKMKQVGFPGSSEGKRIVKGNINLLQVFMELDDHFLKASESAHDVSKMLEATRLHFHSNFADNRGHIDHSARVMRVITWNRSFRGLPNNDDLNDDFDTEEHETHATVLDKLLAWEKKLFEEVKAGEIMKFEYQKKVAALNKLKKKGSNFEAIEKAKATVSHLHTRYIVDMQSMDSTVSEINRIRDQQLYPKLVQLVNGMATMWETMHFHHGSQLKVVAALRMLDISQSPKETSDHHHERTVQLWAVVQEWHSQLEKLVHRQKDYIKALSNWLRLNLIPTESSLKEKVSSPPRVRSPPIHSLLHVWLDHLEKLPDEVLRNSIFTFATVINTIMQSQEEEMKLKLKCLDTEKELARKSKQFKDWQKKYVQRRGSNADEANLEETGDKDAIAERQAAVEAVEKRLEEEREEHQKLCLHVREKSLGSLKTQLPELFRALSEFSLACSRMYRHLKSISQPLSKIKKPTPQLQFPNPQTFSSSKSWIMSGCKHPKTLSFAIDRKEVDGVGNNEDAAATLADIDRFLFENFRSLYLKEDEDLSERKVVAGGGGRDCKNNRGVVSPESPVDSYGGSHRFFFSPDLSGSLPDDSQTESSEHAGSSSSSLICEDQGKNPKLPNDCIAILRQSPNPSEEFRRSMEEMMDSHLKHHEKVDWEFMEELLFCFLKLNEKKSYKYILNAFVDLIVILRRKAEEAPAKPRTVRSVRMVRRMI